LACEPRGLGLKENIEIIPAGLAQGDLQQPKAQNKASKKPQQGLDSKNINKGIDVMNKDIEMLDSRLEELKIKNKEERLKMKNDIRKKRNQLGKEKVKKGETAFELVLQKPLTGLSLHEAAGLVCSGQKDKDDKVQLNRQQSDDVLVRNLIGGNRLAENLGEKLDFLEQLDKKIEISEPLRGNGYLEKIEENLDFKRKPMQQPKIEISEVVSEKNCGESSDASPDVNLKREPAMDELLLQHSVVHAQSDFNEMLAEMKSALAIEPKDYSDNEFSKDGEELD
jgi:hypothetical protein